MSPPKTFEGFILAGGQSRRMGSPKALAEVEGVPIVARVATTLSDVLPSVRIVTDRPDEVAFLHLPVIPDTFSAAGPLGGLHAALSATDADALLLVSCDLPFLTSDFLRRLIAHHGRRPATVPQTDQLHPACAVYDRSLLPLAEERLEHGVRSMMGFVEKAGYDVFDLAAAEPPIGARVLTNVNTPDDLAAARSLRA